MNFDLVKLDKKKFEELQSQWLEVISEQSDSDPKSALDLEFGLSFRQIQESFEATAIPGLAFYVLVEVATERIYALLEMIHGTKEGNPLTKSMRLELSPAYWFGAMDVSEADVYSAAVELMFHQSLSAENNGFTLKFFGRNEAMLNILLGVYKLLEVKNHEHFKCSLDGRWLSVSMKKVKRS